MRWKVKPQVVVVKGELSVGNVKKLPIHDLDLTKSVVNLTGRSIHVVSRSGVVYTVPPLPSHPASGIVVIRVTARHLSARVKVDTSSLNYSSNKDDSLIYESVATGTYESYNGVHSSKYDVTIDQATFNKYGGKVYVESVDLVIACCDLSEVPPHPYSVLGKSTAAVRDDAELQSGLKYRIEIIDNYAEYGDRFVNVLGEVFKIEAVVDGSMEPGVYKYTSPPVTSSNSSLPPTAKRYTWAEADAELSLWKTFAEAETAGDVQTARQAELAKIKHEQALAEIAAKAKHSEDELERKRQEFFEDQQRKEREHQRKLDQLQEERRLTLQSMDDDLIRKQRQFMEELSRKELDWRLSQERTRDDFYDRRKEKRRERKSERKYLKRIKRIEERVLSRKDGSAKLKHELDSLKQQYEMERIRNDHSLALTKHSYEERSANRKDTTEVLKFMPLLVSGIASAAGYILSRI